MKTNGTQTIRATLMWAFLATAAWAIVTVRFQNMPIKTAALMVPFFFAILFFTMRATNRISAVISHKAEERAIRKLPPPKAPPEPSSERPEHAQRRRAAEARRPRGGTRRRE